MTFEEFKKKKQDGSLVNRESNQSHVSDSKGMSFEEFKNKKQNGTLLSKPVISNSAVSAQTYTANRTANIPQTNVEKTTQSVLNSLINHDTNSNNIIGRMRANTKDMMENADIREMTADEKQALEDKYKPNQKVDAAYYGKRATEGLMRAGENIVDGATIATTKYLSTPMLKGAEFITSAGGLAPNPVSNTLKEAQKETWDGIPKRMLDTKIADFYAENKISKYAPNAVEQLGGDVLSGAAGMLPTIGSNILLPGSGYAVLGTQGFGSGVDEAYSDTGELGNKEMAYGGLSGLSEVAIEKLSGGIAGLGKGGLKELGEKVIKNRFIRGALGEGAEEMIQTAVDPFLKRATYDPDAELASPKEIGYSGLVGTLTNLMLGAPGEVSQALRTNKGTRKLPQMDSGTLRQIEDIESGKYKNINAETNNLPQMDARTQRQLQSIMINKNDGFQNAPQTQNIQQANVTLPTQAEMAQRANMEQNNMLPTKFAQEVDEALNNSTSKGNIIIGKTNNYIVDKVKQILGIDVTNRNHVLSKDYIRHMKKHMNETSENQIPITVEDIKKVPDIINNPDDVIRGSDTLSSDRKTKIPSIRYIKTDAEGKMYVIEAIPNKGSLQIKTMWKEPTELIHDTSALHHTPEAVNSNLSTTNNIIPNNEVNINTKYSPNVSNDTADEQSAFSMPENKEEQLNYQGTNLGSGKPKETGINVSNAYNKVSEMLDKYDTIYNESMEEALDQIKKAKDNPDSEIKIYRASPSDKINNGDWVYLSQKQAERWTKTHFGRPKPNYSVTEMTVKAKDVEWSGKNLDFVYLPKLSEGADEASFSISEKYISPLTDLQSATDFVKSATVKDVDTLQKMVDEVEKYPNRVDLQFFAEKARKRIEYLTKSQRYQRSKISNLIDTLVKSYGIDKSETKKAISEYVQEYNSDGDSEVLKKKLLKQLSNGGVLNGQPLTEIANMIDEFNRDLDTVKRYEVDRAQKKQENVDYQLNYDTVSKLYELKKDYQKTADKAMQSILLTKSDTVQLDRLLKGEITLDELPKNVNRNEIEKAYEVKKPLEDVKKEIQNYNKVIKQRRNEKMRDLVSNSANWKDKKSGLAYARETQERNIADIAPQEEARRINKELFEPVHRNEAQATRYKNDVRDKIKELNIELKPKYEVTYNDAQGMKTEKVSESGLVQLYGEGKINDDILKELGVDVNKIKRSVETFRAIYDDLYSKTNKVLVQNGYAPVEFRKDYFPHFEETKPDTLIGKALAKLGFKIDTRELPTDIAGLTHTFRPGKKWVSNFLQRTTDVATYDAIKGLDSYLDGVADVIYHTEDIQNLRAFENALRYQHSEEAIKEQIDEIMDSDVASEMKQSMIDRVYADAENSLAHYVTDLRAYTDNLAGKKALEDRTMEHNLRRGIYNITKNVQSRVSANMVGANISSALTNFIPLTQATAVIDTSNLLQATYDTVKNSIKNDGFVEQSDFLVNRRGSDKLYKTAVDKLAGVTNLMSLFDNITSEIINRGRYYQNVSNGMSEVDARIEADQMSASIMADRSKGSMPTLFNQSNPVTKLLTAFQLEVNNQYSYLLKDIPKEYKDKVVGNLIWAFAKMFIGAWLYNELYEKMTGRRAALDPINIVTETVGDVVDGKKASEVVSGLATEIAEDVPFVGGLINGGRLPISSAIPDIPEVAKAGFSLFEDGDKKKARGTLRSELSKPVFYILPPFGGGQLKKSIEGISTYVQGGNYGVNSKGEETLKYPVEQTPINFVKSALFGKWSTNGAVDYVDNGFKPLSVKQTEAYKKALDAGIKSEQFYAAYNAQKKIKDLGDLTSLAKKNEIDKAIRGMSKEKREMLYETFGVSKSEWNNTKILFPYEIEKKKQEIAKQKLKKKNDK